MAEPNRSPVNQWERAEKLANEVLEECRVQLMLKFRFLDLALWHMPLEAVRTQMRYPLATDAKSVYFEPTMELTRFEESFVETVRDYLHLIMHCIFRHPFDSNHKKVDPWWIACDVIAESTAMEICGTRFESSRDAERREIIDMLRMTVGVLTPTKLYKLFCNAMEKSVPVGDGSLNLDKIFEIEDLFERDDHSAWPGYSKQDETDEPGDTQELTQEDESAEQQGKASDDMEQQLKPPEEQSEEDKQLQPEGDDESAGDSDEDAQNQQVSDQADDSSEDAQSDNSQQGSGNGEGSDDEQDSQDEQSEEEKSWEEISKQIEMDLQTFSKEWGDEANGMITSLQVANRKVYDYTEFLRRFSMLTEDMKINMDEFDYVYYTYGMDLYGNIPLIEPLEYMETNRVRDFVVSIDTSGSCSGELVKRFVEHTFDILKESESFGSKVNIHIIQCDAKVQADTKITDLRDIDAYLENFYVRGYGGTDFRPVFDYVQKLQDEGELLDLQGMVYFTDGLGYFPDKAPDYDVAFVFMSDGVQKLPPVPPWAMKVVVDEEGIEALKVGKR